MIPGKSSKPRLRLDPTAQGHQQGPPSSYATPAPEQESRYPHTSVFRSLHMEMRIFSPSVKILPSEGKAAPRSLPIYGDHDKLEGVVTLDPSLQTASGHLTVSVEGIFTYEPGDTEAIVDASDSPPLGRHRHVFYSSTVTPSSPQAEVSTPLSASLRDAFKSIRRKASLQSMKSPRRENFAFDIPALMRPGEEMPPSFSLSKLMEGGIRGRASVEVVDVAYRVIALWESHDGSENRVMLEAPFLFRPDTEFHSLDGGSLDPESWLEVPLVSDRQIPFQCAVTMPNPATFPRSASLPYFVVYTTTPKSVPLSREIAADATIAVSLVRQIMIKQEHPLRSRSSSNAPRIRTISNLERPRRIRSPSDSSSSSGLSSNASPNANPTVPSFLPSTSSHDSSADEDSDVQLVTVPRNKLYKRAASKTAPARFPTFGRVNEKNTLQGLCDRPLPPLPGEQRKTRGAFSESRTLQTDIFVGFPKRPRNPGDPRGHPSLEEHISLPDGLYKGRLPLHRDMIPTISWGGLQVKYYLDISVLFGQDELRARVPIRLF